MSEFQDYLGRLSRQRPEVERIRDAAKSRGDFVTMRNAESLLKEWARLIVNYVPANDFASLA